MLKKSTLKKIHLTIISLCLIFSLALGFTAQVHAQTKDEEDLITFSQLYSGTRTLRGPQESTSMGFKLPAHWAKPTGGQLDLNFSVLLFGTTNTNVANPSFKAILQVWLNNIDLGSVVIEEEGLQTAIFPIPGLAWTNVGISGTNDITIQFTTNDECGGTSIVTIDSSSVLTIHHQKILPTIDLRALPWPLYQSTFFPSSAVLIIPDQPSASELKAAMIVAAGFGRLTSGDIQLTTQTNSTLTDTIQKSSNLVFIGKSDSFPELKTITWPSQPTGVTKDDGILQMVVSPWNDEKVILWVSGSSDDAVIKASQAFSSGEVRTGIDPSTAVITETKTISIPQQNVIDLSLSTLGYADEYRQGNGSHSIEYEFTIPYNQSASNDGSLTLVYANSAILDFTRSGFSISVNDEYIGGLRLTERSTNTVSDTLLIPQGTIKPGKNKITIQETFKFSEICARPLDSDLWAVVRPESRLHIPLGPVETTERLLDLNYYPNLFGPTINSLAFILAPKDSLSWGIATEIAYDLGQKAQGVLIDPQVAFADALPEDLQEKNDLLIIGHPTDLPIIAEMGDTMPAPFPANSNFAIEPQSELTFLIEKNTPQGYIEMFKSPWSKEHVVFTLLGNNQQGLMFARAALLTPELRNKLLGNLAVVQKQTIYSYNVKEQQDANSIEIVSVATPTPIAAESESTGLSQPNLLLIGVIAVILFVFAAIFIIMQRRRTLNTKK